MALSTPSLNQYWSQNNLETAADRWMNSNVQAFTTGNCLVSSQTCHLDNSRYQGMSSLNELLSSVPLTPRFNTTCHEQTPCVRDGDWCSWRTHPPQAADCQTNQVGRQLHITRRDQGGRGTVFNGNVYGTNTVIHHSSSSSGFFYSSNGVSYQSSMHCIFSSR